jgi:DNA-binding response OmpR family regulator
MSGHHASALPRVAIVDDEQDVLTFLRLVLEDAGCLVLTCRHPASALERVAEFRPHLICLDLLMPERTGVSLYVETRHDARLADVPVLILSGLNARDALIDLLHREGDIPPPAGYIEKPVEAERFLEAARAALGSSRPGAPA